MTTAGTNKRGIAFIGFGEASGAIVSGWGGEMPATLSAYDVKTDGEGAVREAKLADYARAGVAGALSNAAAVSGAEVVFSLVTADKAYAAAEETARNIRAGTHYLDGNSCAPQTKQRSAAIIEAAGGRYTDVAVMAPVYPLRHRTPMLLSGPHVSEIEPLLKGLGMDVSIAGEAVGRASAMKLVRSIVMKGLEALALECLLAGRRLGVEDVVLASLDQTYPGFDWTARTAQMLERAMVHGVRRAAEMEEAAVMVAGLGLPDNMTAATARWQKLVGDLDLKGEAGPDGPDAGRRRADAINRALDGRARS